ncbi:hypothetical protein EDD95_3062 [Streptomyces sp. CEV 2-1]|nr:hypothetical protein EDD95_3062 [Streptomyces sp. CEV 2-1]
MPLVLFRQGESASRLILLFFFVCVVKLVYEPKLLADINVRQVQVERSANSIRRLLRRSELSIQQALDRSREFLGQRQLVPTSRNSVQFGQFVWQWEVG